MNQPSSSRVDPASARRFGAGEPARAAECAYFRRLMGERAGASLRGEAPLAELLADPILRRLMRHDGVSLRELRDLLAEAEARLARGLCRLALA